MSQRDTFALYAMLGQLASGRLGLYLANEIAEEAYRIADAMTAASKTTVPEMKAAEVIQ